MAKFRLFIFGALTAVFLTVSAAAQKDDEAIKVDSSVVILNATITDAAGKPVAAINEKQFKVYEDGKLQEISYFARDATPFAAVILIDTSGSMESRISMARSAAINFLDGLQTDDVTAIYNFDSKVQLVQDFSNSRDVSDQTYNLKARGTTVLNDAIYQAAQVLSQRAEKRRAIIVLSDGADTSSRKSADKALKAAFAANATIYTVDMSAVDANGTDRMQSIGALKNFAEKSGGVFVSTSGGAAMRTAFKNIVEELGAQYTIGYQPPITSKDGKWHTLEIKVSRPNLNIRTRQGYNAAK